MKGYGCAGESLALLGFVQMNATSDRIAEQNEMFAVRTEAQLKAWHHMIDRLKASAKAFASDRKHEIDSTIATIRVRKARLQALKAVRKELWSALNKALAESRSALDHPNCVAYEALKRATK